MLHPKWTYTINDDKESIALVAAGFQPAILAPRDSMPLEARQRDQLSTHNS
jgi:hypothetical protein